MTSERRHTVFSPVINTFDFIGMDLGRRNSTPDRHGLETIDEVIFQQMPASRKSLRHEDRIGSDLCADRSVCRR